MGPRPEDSCGKFTPTLHIRVFGLLEDIVSHRGPQFMSKVWKELLWKLNITVSLTSGYHPQANGQVERANQELGFQPPLYLWNPPTSDQPAVEAWCRCSERVWEGVHQKLHKAIAAYKRKADRRRGDMPLYEPGQKMWVSTADDCAGSHGKLATSHSTEAAVLANLSQMSKDMVIIQGVSSMGAAALNIPVTETYKHTRITGVQHC
ncbi:hypothetical protein P4O66_004741 [Electrophorus voltai]|uniref:Integrase catalytic domain-containing protein n=1 Tax=Electrophorus voltai TaxID=2609070 RepID=A0AAD8ZL21_9TELE|nr:hypothetical protein P4O66_004741 [Electrophorus voltai]